MYGYFGTKRMHFETMFMHRGAGDAGFPAHRGGLGPAPGRSAGQGHPHLRYLDREWTRMDANGRESLKPGDRKGGKRKVPRSSPTGSAPFYPPYFSFSAFQSFSISRFSLSLPYYLPMSAAIRAIPLHDFLPPGGLSRVSP